MSLLISLSLQSAHPLKDWSQMPKSTLNDVNGLKQTFVT